MHIRLATRGSRLALAQSGQVADALRGLGAEVELVRVQTVGDVTSAPLSSLGGVGVFVAAVREAVLTRRCDAAVHSLKDLPTTPPDGLALAAVPRREDPRDALCARDGLTLATLPSGATVGTGSPRRATQLLAVRPDLRVIDIRGNVDTRLGRVGADLDAVVLAMAGLTRIGRTDAVTEALESDVLVPAPAQGALAIECRPDDAELVRFVAQLDDPFARAAVALERDVMRLVEAGCSAPFGALATVIDGSVEVTARLASASGHRTTTRTADASDAAALAEQVANELAPLRGLRVLMPPSRLATALRTEGVLVTETRLTSTEPLDPAPVVQALGNDFDVLALTSARTLDVLDEAGVHLADLLDPAVTVAAVGPTTAAAAERAGLRVAIVPATHSGGAALAAAFPSPAGRVLIPGAEQPAPDLASGLIARGWRVSAVPVYRTVPASAIDPAVADAWPDGFDAVVVTAPSVARAVAELLGRPAPPVIALGTTSAAAAAELGLVVAATAAEPSAAGVAAALQALRKDPI